MGISIRLKQPRLPIQSWLEAGYFRITLSRDTNPIADQPRRSVKVRFACRSFHRNPSFPDNKWSIPDILKAIRTGAAFSPLALQRSVAASVLGRHEALGRPKRRHCES